MADTKKKKRASLSSFTILLIILVALAVITVIMAACGVEGIEGATLSGVLTAPVFGFQDAIGVCLFVMILGGFLGIVTETGALDAGIAALVHKLKGNELVLIPILMAIFSIGGTTYGMCEETVPFYLLLAATMVAAGFDSLTGAAVVLALGGGLVTGAWSDWILRGLTFLVVSCPCALVISVPVCFFGGSGGACKLGVLI